MPVNSPWLEMHTVTLSDCMLKLHTIACCQALAIGWQTISRTHLECKPLPAAQLIVGQSCLAWPRNRQYLHMHCNCSVGCIGGQACMQVKWFVLDSSAADNATLRQQET